jgi:DNA-binding response OmpR family regulator
MSGKILVVDDDPLAARLMGLSLGSEGFQVSTAANASEGLRAIQAERPDLIILDIMMPDIDGIQMCQQLRSQPSTADIPIILLTGKTQTDDKIAGLRAGADDYITKPADPREVMVRVEAVLARTRRSAPIKQGQVLALIGAKGGVGTSTVAVNLGVALARRPTPTVLLDLHHLGGTVVSQLRLTPRTSLADLLALQPEQISPQRLERVLTGHPTGLRALTSPPGGANWVELPVAHASAIVRSATPMADVVLLDLPHVPSPASKEVLGLCDMALLVLAPDPTTLACAEQMITWFESAGLSAGMIATLLVNRSQAAVTFSVNDVEKKLQKRCLGAIPPAHEELAFAERRGEPLALARTQSIVTMALREVTDRVYSLLTGGAVKLG